MVNPSPAAAETLAILGAVFWSIQLIPQICLNYRRRSTQGLSTVMMLLWACAGAVLGIYNVSADLSVALWVQAQILTGLSLISAAQCFYYGRSWSITRCLATLIITLCFFAGIETAGILGLQQLKGGVVWPENIFAVLATVLLATGVLKEYLEIISGRSVEGISIIFVLLDAAGDLTSLLSLLYRKKLDIWGLAIYGVELGLWVGIVAIYVAFKAIGPDSDKSDSLPTLSESGLKQVPLACCPHPS